MQTRGSCSCYRGHGGRRNLTLATGAGAHAANASVNQAWPRSVIDSRPTCIR